MIEWNDVAMDGGPVSFWGLVVFIAWLIYLNLSEGARPRN